MKPQFPWAEYNAALAKLAAVRTAHAKGAVSSEVLAIAQRAYNEEVAEIDARFFEDEDEEKSA